MRRALLVIAAIFWLSPVVLAAQEKATWRSATMAELEAFLPARAPVEKERIETEMRTATGITNDAGQTIAAVVLITAGYAADGKYSHYLLAQHAMHIGDGIALPAGAYVLGWGRTPDGLLLHVFDAATGQERGSGVARLSPTALRIESFKIWAPGERKMIQIGRFLIPYRLD